MSAPAAVKYVAPVYDDCPGVRVAHYLKEHSTLTGTAYAVALALATFYYNPAYGCAFPSIETLAQAARVTGRSVQTALNKIRESGEWVIVPGSGKRTDVVRSEYPQIGSNLYYPVFDADKLPEGVSLREMKSIVVRTTTREDIPPNMLPIEPPMDAEMAPPVDMGVMP